MVRFEEGKIIIEIETLCPIDDVKLIQRSLIDIISILNYDYVATIQENLYYVCMLINELSIDTIGLKSMFNTRDGRHIFKDRINGTFVNEIIKDEMVFRQSTKCKLIPDEKIEELTQIAKGFEKTGIKQTA